LQIRYSSSLLSQNFTRLIGLQKVIYKFQILIDPGNDNDNKVGPDDHNSRQKKVTADKCMFIISFNLNLIVSHLPEAEGKKDNEVILIRFIK
jgi:hypothetical protein